MSIGYHGSIPAAALALSLLAGMRPGPLPAETNRDQSQDQARSTLYLPYAAKAPAGALVEVGQIGGSVTAMAVAGRYVFQAIGPRVLVIDIADRYAPRQVGASPELPGIVAGLAPAQASKCGA